MVSPARSRRVASRSHSLGEADRLGELDVAHLAGEHDHPAAALDRGELLVIAGDQHPAVAVRRPGA